MMLPTIVQKLLKATQGDLSAIAELADQANGGHVAEFFKSSEEKLKAGVDADTRDAVLEMAKLVAYNATQLRVAIEIIAELVRDKQISNLIESKWTGNSEPQPDLRDVIVGAVSIAPAYATTTGPIRQLYIQALRGSYAPEIYTFGFGPELLSALIAARLAPADIEALATLERDRTRQLSLESHGAELESFERLAHGDFVEIMQIANSDTGAPVFITHRTQATQRQIKIRRTDKGARLLKMIKIGSGEV